MTPVTREQLKPGLAVKILAALEPNEMNAWHRGTIHSVTHIGSRENFTTSCEVRVRRGEQSYAFQLHEEELRSILYVEGSPKSYLEIQLDDAIERRDQWHAECGKLTEALTAERAAHAETKKDLESAQDNTLAIRQVLDEVRRLLGSEEAARITSLAAKWVTRTKVAESDLDNAKRHADALYEENKKLVAQLAEANARPDRNFDAYQKEKKKFQDVTDLVDKLK